MANATTFLRNQLMDQIGAPFDFAQVRSAFNSSSASAADFLGLRRPARGARMTDDARAAMIRRRKTFQQSWSRWNRGTRAPHGGSWPRLQNAGGRKAIIDRVRRVGLRVLTFDGEVDTYGADVRDRQINEEVYIAPDDLENAAGYSFYRGLERNDWTEATRAVATAWFANYIGNDMSGGDATWGDTAELVVVFGDLETE